jgi:hypothetical protein
MPVSGYVGATKVASVSPGWKQNLFKQSEALGTAPWSMLGGAVAVENYSVSAIGLAWTQVTDTNVLAFAGVTQSLAVPNDGTLYVLEFYVKKTTGGTSKTVGLNGNLLGGTQVTSLPRINTDTGAVLSGVATVVDAGDAWKVSSNLQNNTSGNVSLQVDLYPALNANNAGSNDSATVGSALFSGVQVRRSTALNPAYVETTSTAIDTPDSTTSYEVTTPSGGPVVAGRATAGSLNTLTLNTTSGIRTTLSPPTDFNGGTPTVGNPPLLAITSTLPGSLPSDNGLSYNPQSLLVQGGGAAVILGGLGIANTGALCMLQGVGGIAGYTEGLPVDAAGAIVTTFNEVPT